MKDLLIKLTQKPLYIIVAVAIVSFAWFHWQESRVKPEGSQTKNAMQNAIMVTLVVAGVVYLKQTKMSPKESLVVAPSPI